MPAGDGSWRIPSNVMEHCGAGLLAAQVRVVPHAASTLTSYRPSSASGRTRIERWIDALVALKPHARKKRTLRHATDRRPQRYAIKC
eukprot:scaffold112402_cov84-Phaeocystis_antarctica.AAC.1